jgi:hypothetical protein
LFQDHRAGADGDSLGGIPAVGYHEQVFRNLDRFLSGFSRTHSVEDPQSLHGDGVAGFLRGAKTVLLHRLFVEVRVDVPGCSLEEETQNAGAEFPLHLKAHVAGPIG